MITLIINNSSNKGFLKDSEFDIHSKQKTFW